MTSDTQAAIRAFLDDRADDQVRFLAELVKVPSDNPPGDCAGHAERTAELLEELGFTVERHAVPAESCRAHGMIGATNLVVRHRFGDGPTAALNAHGDVVPPGEGWTTDPYGAEIRDGMMYGRGVAVSKSDFATFTYALLALQSLASPPAGTVELHLTYDEEAGGEIGPKRLLDNGTSRPDYVICPGFSYNVVIAHNGCLHLAVEVRGKSAHAAMPDTGHDALEAATKILSALYESRAALGATSSNVSGIGSPSLVIGLIEGGINTNVVPDKVTFRLDRRMIPEEDAAAVEAELRATIAAAADLPGITCTVSQVMLARPFAPVEGTDRLAEIVAGHAARVMGEAVPVEGVPLYADARHYAAAGIPTVMYGAGPHTLLEANGHRADERVGLADLRKATEVVALSVLDLLRGPESG